MFAIVHEIVDRRGMDHSRWRFGVVNQAAPRPDVGSRRHRQARRGEYPNIVFNAILGILAAFVTYGRFVLEPF
jgi:hypothetical protein